MKTETENNSGAAYVYTTAMAINDLGGIPDLSEIQRLVQHYPTYEKPHRKGVLSVILGVMTIDELLKLRAAYQGVPLSVSTQKKGGYSLGQMRWPPAKLQRTVIRLLYLRYTLDQPMTRRQANQKLNYKFTFTGKVDGAGDVGKSSVRRATARPKRSKTPAL